MNTITSQIRKVGLLLFALFFSRLVLAQTEGGTPQTTTADILHLRNYASNIAQFNRHYPQEKAAKLIQGGGGGQAHFATGGQFQSADTLSTQLAQPPRGLIVNSIGATSGKRSGTVRYATLHILHNNSTRVAISDALIANYISEGGDSGGIVYAYQSSNNTRYTVGINKGRVSLREPNGEIETYAVCVKAYMINRRLGLTRY